MSETNGPDDHQPGDQPGDQPPGDQQPGFGGQPPGYGQGPPFGQPPGYGQTMPFGPYLPPGPPGYGDAATELSSETSPILVSFAAPAKQNRWTVLIRAIMAIPHFIVVWALGVAAAVVAIIGWFAALFTGQLPSWAHLFLTQVLRWQTRVYAYYCLLTDKYPPFSLDDDAYPVRLVSRPTRLNRLAVFFRVILVFPAYIVAIVLGYGLYVLAFFVWLIALITGGLPTALHQALAAVVRFFARFSGYVNLVTAEQPWHGLYGDKLPVGSTDLATPWAAAPSIGLAPEAGQASAASATAELASGPLAAQPAVTIGDPWRLQLSSGAKNLVTTMMIVGALAYVALFTFRAVSTTRTLNNAYALSQLEQVNTALTKVSQGIPAAISACNNQLGCVTGLIRKEAGYLRTFDSQLQGIPMYGQAASDEATLLADDKAAEADLNLLGASTSNAQYLNIASSNKLQQDLNTTSADYTKLVRDLGGVSG